MDADNCEALLSVALLPTPVPGVVVDAINSAEGPKVDYHHVSAELGEGEGLGVDPFLYVTEFGRLGFQTHRSLLLGPARHQQGCK